MIVQWFYYINLNIYINGTIVFVWILSGDMHVAELDGGEQGNWERDQMDGRHNYMTVVISDDMHI